MSIDGLPDRLLKHTVYSKQFIYSTQNKLTFLVGDGKVLTEGGDKKVGPKYF